MRMWGFRLILIGALAGCAESPRFAVRPQPTPRSVAAAPAAKAPATKATPDPDAPSVLAPEPIGAQPIKPEPAPIGALRGRQSPGPPMPVRSAPLPALETPAEAVVRPDETVFEFAERMRTPVQAIIAANGLKPPYDVTPGDRLKVPAPVIYVVKPGDTFTTVGRRFAIEPRSLASLNDLPISSPLKPGQRLALPTGAKEAPLAKSGLAPIGAAPAALKPLTEAAAGGAPRPDAKLEAKSEARGESKPEPTEPSAESVVAAGKGKFTWPAKGDILSNYGLKGGGQRNDGINIAVKVGEPIRAAAAGVVVYAGNSIPGFGNLIVVKHPDGWTSLYGNLGKMSVKIRAEVGQGDPIGVAGQSGAVDRPQVHFELRHASSPQEKARPIDPQSVLP